MSQFVKILFIIFVVTSVSLSQDIFFDSQGKKIEKVAKRTKEPKIIMDTLKLSAGIGIMVLPEVFKRGRHSIKATSNKYILATITQILPDTSYAVQYYGYYASKNGDSVIVKSDSNTDTSTVVVKIFLR